MTCLAWDIWRMKDVGVGLSPLTFAEYLPGQVSTFITFFSSPNQQMQGEQQHSRWACQALCWPFWLFIPQMTRRTHCVSYLLPFLVLSSSNLDLLVPLDIYFLPLSLCIHSVIQSHLFSCLFWIHFSIMAIKWNHTITASLSLLPESHGPSSSCESHLSSHLYVTWDAHPGTTGQPTSLGISSPRREHTYRVQITFFLLSTFLSLIFVDPTCVSVPGLFHSTQCPLDLFTFYTWHDFLPPFF